MQRVTVLKKIISIVLCIVMLFVPLSVFAIPLSSGDDALRDEFLSGSNSILNYSYFVPTLSEGEKYPLVVWLHGVASGNYDGNELDSYEFCKWASDEYQARFVNAGGAFLLCPRCPGGWDATTTDILMDCIAAFISEFSSNIDTTRIYISGFSVGAVMVLRMVNDYPSFFAGAVPISAITQNSSHIKNMKNTAVWFFANEKDTFIGANASSTRSSYNTLKGIIFDKSALRFTYVSNAVTPSGGSIIMQHNMWRSFTNDMFMDDTSQYAYSTTLDGYGNTVSFTYPNGVINWLSSQARTDEARATEKTSLWSRIVAFFNMIFSRISGLFS